MNKLLKLFFITIIIYNNIAFAKETGFYMGAAIGIVEPVVRKFRHKYSNTGIILKQSNMYSGKIGYIIYPQISMEFSATYQPKYRLHYSLQHKNLINGLTIPKTIGNTTIVSNIYMLNLIYDLEKIKTFTPFIILGGGITRVKVKSTSSKWSLINNDYFKVHRTSKNCVTWQAGLGIAQHITPDLSIDATAKLQTAYRVRINYDTLDMKTVQLMNANSIKKTISVGEFGIGFTYRLPF
ncbi:hypothetical protein MA5_00900 [Rickettsia prowazekii str. GvV257]|nr:outer membrane beta-barrel protein [Rickettsia prowazekii]EOB10290.1 hypothetical protein H376_4380 [Rickettsia prowazekii str. GvF12]ADE30352.1 putative invasin, adhesin and agglutinin 1-like protein [Rickettsia prowazekii str. Rp22]AFE49583.1 hypothetical protein M9W_03815 [Rickettsia prowazekii str. Chernikova]AFE50427.1 hypothetical protein M9Y_03820 [Rickettsia prowazekii str. Katsinyian]AFE51271.1 hypothetical protein MA1_03810 [Rickettsia prowazekii str. BuV67-CWPP]